MYLDLNNQEFENCCGMAEIGGFGDLPDHLDALKADYENDGEKVPSQAALLKEVIAEMTDAIQSEIRSGKKAYIATTAAHQKHAIAALQKLRFTAVDTFPGQEGPVTLWLKKTRR